MCAKFLRPAVHNQRHNFIYRGSEWVFDRTLAAYDTRFAGFGIPTGHTRRDHPGGVPERLPLHHRAKGFFPQQDTGRIGGSVQAAQDYLFQACATK